MKKVSKYSVVFFISIVSIILIFFLLNKVIKPNNIKENLINSIEKKDDFYYLINKKDFTKIDNRADMILLNIMYNYDGSFKSLLNSKYYDEVLLDSENDLKYTIETNKTNNEYLRYWHGSTIIYRILFTFLDINGVYIFNFVILLLMSILVLYKLFKIDKKLMYSFLISYLLVNLIITPLCFEYYSTIILSMIFTLLIVKFKDKNTFFINSLFLIGGIFTCFFDFLTTELLVLLLPMLTYMYYLYKNKMVNNYKDCLKKIILFSMFFLIGYVSMFLLKWMLSYIILDIDLIESVLKIGSNRLVGQVDSNYFFQLISIFNDNIKNIIPISFINKYTFVVIVVLLLVFSTFFYLYRKPKKDLWFCKVLFTILLIPFIRLFVLINHSTLHSFFTYRVLLISIMCLILINLIGIDKKLIRRKK